MLSKELEQSILSKVEKPARYIGNEINQIKKDFLNTAFKMALSYPDLYEIGMSNLGIKILYELINKEENMLCERVFHPWVDMAKILREEAIPLYSLESKQNIRDFDVLGFSLQYELTFTNVLSILELSLIPIERKNRTDTDPIIIAGGPCVYNPRPLEDFIDLFVLGEAEEGIITLANMIIELKKINSTKAVILKELSKLDFVFVPEFSKEKPIHKLTVHNINHSNYPIKPPIPYIQVVQDHGVIEVARGCTVGCRFCQAGNIYRPLRERTIDNIVELAYKIIQNTGYKRISLLSLSIADYTNLGMLIDTLNSHFSHKNISFSFPSLRIDAFSLDNALKIKKVRKTSLTFAVEAGSEYTRSVINKSVSEDKLFEIVREITKLGWRNIKLYFMLGFPLDSGYESSEEDDIISLLDKLLNINKKLLLSVSIGTFIPKSHTPFERSEQMSKDKVLEKISKIRASINSRRIKFKIHSADMSFIEGLIARGDKSTGKLIYEAYKKGSIFDGWNDKFNISNWLYAIEKCKTDIDYALFKKDTDRSLPWSNINALVSQKFLQKEYDKSIIAEESPDCRDKCHEFCGVCHKPLDHSLNNASSDKEGYKDIVKSIEEKQYTVLIQFVKLGMFKFLSHIDVFSLFQKALIRANIPVVFTKGFNPIPKIDIANPLALGIESHAEYMQIKLFEEKDALYIKEVLNKELKEGIKISDIFITDKPIPKLNKLCTACEYEIVLPKSIDKEKLIDSSDKIKSLDHIKAYRKDKTKQTALLSLEYKQESLMISFKVDSLFANLFDYLHIITDIEKEELISFGIKRLKQYSDYENKTSPMSLVKSSLNKSNKDEHLVVI